MSDDRDPLSKRAYYAALREHMPWPWNRMPLWTFEPWFNMAVLSVLIALVFVLGLLWQK